MKQFILLFVTLALVACTPQPTLSAATSTDQPGAVEAPFPSQTATYTPTTPTAPIPATQEISVTSTVMFSTTPTPQSITPPTAYQPQPGDSKLQRAEAFPDTVQVDLSSNKGVLPVLSISGSLPTPCHQLRAIVSQPDSKNRINIKLYSLVNPEMMCAQVLKSFNLVIQLDQLKQPGEYIILVNNKEMTRFQWQ
jgi:hypothetical protein